MFVNRFNGWILKADVAGTVVQFVNLHLRPSMNANSRIPSLYTLFFTSVHDRMEDVRHWFQSVELDKPTGTNEHKNGKVGFL
jgi:hypothetical protein